MIKNCFYILLVTITLSSCKQNKELNDLATNNDENVTVEKLNLLGKEAQVYTTAENTDKRLTLDLQKTFSNAKQPLETEVAIFVNPKKQFISKFCARRQS